MKQRMLFDNGVLRIAEQVVHTPAAAGARACAPTHDPLEGAPQSARAVLDLILRRDTEDTRIPRAGEGLRWLRAHDAVTEHGPWGLCLTVVGQRLARAWRLGT